MATPAPSNLYKVRDPSEDEMKLLFEKEHEEYHTLTTQLVYVSNRGRPDLQTFIVFHYTRV